MTAPSSHELGYYSFRIKKKLFSFTSSNCIFSVMLIFHKVFVICNCAPSADNNVVIATFSDCIIKPADDFEIN